LKNEVAVWFMDECHFQQHGSRLTAWFPKDEKDPIVRHASTRKKVGIIGAVKANDETLFACEEEKFNAQTIEAFFSELVAHRKAAKTMVVVLDNARFHHAKALSGWLEKHSETFRLDFLPPYSPELNHIDCASRNRHRKRQKPPTNLTLTLHKSCRQKPFYSRYSA